MSTRIPADGARSRGTSKSRAAAGARKIGIAECRSAATSVPSPQPGARRLWGRARRSAAQRARRGSERPWNVIDNLPDQVPVTQAELDVIETYLGDLLDKFL